LSLLHLPLLFLINTTDIENVITPAKLITKIIIHLNIHSVAVNKAGRYNEYITIRYRTLPN
ncbi:MAG: hypothetical protein MJE68_10640, partial [Proteobacteria bacterium]|nr:hypothetical protein [Pseudomonadota bacterium]